jgi:hypothetical protein
MTACFLSISLKGLGRKWLWSLFKAPSQHLSGQIVLIFVPISGEQLYAKARVRNILTEVLLISTGSNEAHPKTSIQCLVSARQ